MSLCEAEGIKPQEHCMPRELLKKKQLEAAIAAGKKKPPAQGTLDGVVTKRDIAPSFSRVHTLRAVAEYIVTKDVVSFMTFIA